MPGILSFDSSLGADALEQQNIAEKDKLHTTMYNDDVRRQNLSNLGKIIMSGGKAASQTMQKAGQMKQQAASDEVQKNAAGAGPEGLGEGSSGTPSEQSSGMNMNQIFSLFSTFMSAFNSGGGGS